MPCSDSSSSIDIQFDPKGRFLAFDFAKITCGREITAKTGYSEYCKGKKAEHILKLTYNEVARGLKLEKEDEQFILYLEWDALRSALVQYLGVEDDEIDTDRCHITSIEETEKGTTVALVILPPKELPKIMACGMVDKPSA